MRLTCTVEVINMDAAANGLLNRRTRGCRSTLSVAKKSDSDVFLMMCTAKNKHGTKYKVKDNIEKMFTNYVSDGKATVRLKDPHIDLRISMANVIDLRRLLNAIRMACNGESLIGKGILSSVAPVSNKIFEKPKTKLTVTQKKDYPLLSGFPRALKTLTIAECDLSRIDTRVLKLRYLTSLNLDCNKIKEIPGLVSEMPCLAELSMEENLITRLPDSFCSASSNLCRTLRCLKLGKNQINHLPEDFGNLRELYQLVLTGNKLKFLPYSIGNLSNLKILIVAKNQLKVLPFAIKKLALDRIDAAHNNFMNVGSHSIRNNLGPFTTLQDLASRTVVMKKIPYDEESLTHYCREYVEKGRKCLFCPTVCFRSYIKMALSFELHRIAHNVVHIDSLWRRRAPIVVSLCSLRCFKRFRITKDVLPENSP